MELTDYEGALLLHIVGVLAFFSGIVLAGVAFEAGRRRAQPGEVALLLSLARIGALMAMAGSLVVLAGGLWLTDLGRWELDGGWLGTAFALFLVTVVLGAVGGRTPRRARVLATRLAADGSGSTDELRKLLDDRVSRLVNWLSLVLVFVILFLMIAKP